MGRWAIFDERGEYTNQLVFYVTIRILRFAYAAATF